MKIYFNLCIDEFTNTYVVVNEDPAVKEAFIVDPGKISSQMIDQIEREGYKLVAVLITHSHTSHIKGLNTLMKIYSPLIYAVDAEINGHRTEVIKGDGHITIAGLDVEYIAVPGHSSDSLCFKVENTIFTGDAITSGIIGETTSQYAEKLLQKMISEKIYSQTDETVLMPGHGPPTTIFAEKKFNLDCKLS